jgi:hypothetical protein
MENEKNEDLRWISDFGGSESWGPRPVHEVRGGLDFFFRPCTPRPSDYVSEKTQRPRQSVYSVTWLSGRFRPCGLWHKHTLGFHKAYPIIVFPNRTKAAPLSMVYLNVWSSECIRIGGILLSIPNLHGPSSSSCSTRHARVKNLSTKQLLKLQASPDPRRTLSFQI